MLLLQLWVQLASDDAKLKFKSTRGKPFNGKVPLLILEKFHKRPGSSKRFHGDQKEFHHNLQIKEFLELGFRSAASRACRIRCPGNSASRKTRLQLNPRSELV
jgi:hypothetical protein